jgi:mycothiol synthase
MTGPAVTAGRLTAAQVGDVLALADAAHAADGVAPLSEPVLLHLRYHGGEGTDFLVTADGQTAGYAHLDPPGEQAEPSGELVVGPAHRRHGLGRTLVDGLTARAGGKPVRVWAHGDLPAAAALAASAGFERFRALWQMRRSLREPLDQPDFPAGVTLRTFVPGADEQEWVGLNARAFASHPEQGTWTRSDLELREREPWFDPAGFFIAETDGAMTGFHWTKVHAPQGQSPVGEVYVVGVAPGEQGSGLGRALTLAGLHHLRGLGLDEVMLYVDEDNTAATRMYAKLGFTRYMTDAMYRRQVLVVVDAQRLVEFVGSQPTVGGRHRRQDLAVELDLGEGIAVVNTMVQLSRNRAHLRR